MISPMFLLNTSWMRKAIVQRFGKSNDRVLGAERCPQGVKDEWIGK